MKNEKNSVKRTEDGRFLFQIDVTAGGETEIYLMKHPQFPQKELIAVTDKDAISIELDNLDFRPYFLFKNVGVECIVAERTLPVGGMNNFRDMGGYETEDGRHVKWGMLYRSDHIHNASQKGLEYLGKLDIHTIIDYRSDDEAGKYPNKEIDSPVKTFRLDPDAHTAELAAQFTSSKENEDINLVNKIIEQKKNGTLINRYDIVMEQYRNFAGKEKSQKAFGEMIRIVADSSAPAVVQHCRGGKDRTGFGAMLLLGILGVKKEYIIGDYMLTHFNRIDRNNEKMEGYRKLTEDEDVLNYLYSLIETNPEFLSASMNFIEERYGTIRDYAMEVLGVSESMIEQLKLLYLT